MLMRVRTVLLSGALALASLPLQAAELIMVEEQGCFWCARWNNELADIYPLTDEGRFAPLRRVEKSHLHDSGIAFQRPVAFTPTFVLIEDGQELARIEGYPGEDFFWGLLGMMLKDKTAFTGAGG